MGVPLLPSPENGGGTFSEILKRYGFNALLVLILVVMYREVNQATLQVIQKNTEAFVQMSGAVQAMREENRALHGLQRRNNE